MRQCLFKNRLFQSSVLAVVLGSLAINFGLNNRTGAAAPSPKVQRSTGISASTPTFQPPTATPVAHNDGLPLPGAVPVAGSVENQSNYFTYVVQPNDTLRDLCVSGIGRYDSAVLSEIKKLNPGLTNFDRIEAGQEIRLPVELPR